MMDAQYKNALVLRQNLDAPNRVYVTTDVVRETFEMEYKSVGQEKRLYYYTNLKLGQLSDCFILYAIMTLGVCDLSAILNFLQALHSNNTELSISDYHDMSGIKERLKKLTAYGFLVKNRYQLCREEGRNAFSALYTCTNDAAEFTSKRLGKPYKINNWLQALRPQELISWAAAAKVGTLLSLYPAFSEYGLGRIYINKTVFYMPCELKFHVRDTYYHVAVLNAFLYYDKCVMSQNDFKDYIVEKLNFILQYITYRSNVSEARVVCVVQDNANLVLLVKWLKKAERLQDVLHKIYFTGEGIVNVRNGDVATGLLQLVCSEQYEEGFTFVQSSPDFLG